MDKNAKIYVAGHTGLVGSALYRALQSNGYTNLIFKDVTELDLRRQSDVETFFDKTRPEYVLLAAAKVGGILANSTYKAEFIYDNTAIAMNIIHSAYKFKVKRLLNLGSSCIYPKECPQPMKEEYLLTGPLEETNEPYALAKILAIKLCRYYNEQFGTDFISVMPCNMYGPNDNYNFETSHVLPAFLRKFLVAKWLSEGNIKLIRKDMTARPFGFGLEEKIKNASDDDLIGILKSIGISKNTVTLWGTGNVYREFLFVEDLAAACIFLMNKNDSRQIGEFINIGTGEDKTLRDYAKIIKDIVRFPGDITYDASKPDGMKRKVMDISRIKALGWEPTISFEKGIRIVLETYERGVLQPYSFL